HLARMVPSRERECRSANSRRKLPVPAPCAGLRTIPQTQANPDRHPNDNPKGFHGRVAARLARWCSSIRSAGRSCYLQDNFLPEDAGRPASLPLVSPSNLFGCRSDGRDQLAETATLELARRFLGCRLR